MFGPSSRYRAPWLCSPLLAALFAACSGAATAQSSPIEAALPQSLSADHLEPGAIFALKVVSPWDHDGCHLAAGTLLRATVRRAQHDARNRAAELIFTLTVPCGDRGPLNVIVASLIAPPVITAANQPIPSFFGGLTGKEGLAGPANHAFIDQSITSSETRGERAPRDAGPLIVHVNKLPKTIAAGEVLHLNHIRLALPPPGGTESTIATSTASLHLPESTIFILRAAVAGRDPALTTAIAAVPAPTLAAVARHAVGPFLGPCRAGHCTSSPATLAATASGVTRLPAGQDLIPLGFHPDHDLDVPGLGLATTLHFLADSELLVTFPTHSLIPRAAAERPTDNPTAIRALLFNTSTRAVTRTEDWTVDDHNLYLWPLGPHLLVHDGHQLRLLGPGLQTLATLPLALPLATLRPSPDGQHLMLGEIHELHTVDDHRLLRGTEIRPPEEEILWSLLDGQLHRLATLGTTSSYVPPPTLLNDGLVELRRGHSPEWFLAAKRWEPDPTPSTASTPAATPNPDKPGNTAADHLLGSLHSACVPALDNLAPDLLTLTTCDTTGPNTHTFLVTAAGLPIAEQTSTPQDLPLRFTAAAAAPRVAVLLTRANETYIRNLAFNLAALQAQCIKVLDTSTGVPLATVPLPELAPYQSAFALSPNGRVLALVAGHQLLLYALQP